MNEDPVLMRLSKQHLEKAFSLEDSPLIATPLKELQSKVEVILNPRQARMRMMELARKRGDLAVDFECTGLKPDHPSQDIISCSFCLEGEDTFACMIDERAKEVLSSVLRAPRLAKIASNMQYEERWSMAKLGHGVVNWIWDTMQAAHILDNRPWISGLKFQSYVQFGVPDYSVGVDEFKKSKTANGLNRMREVNPRDLLTYGGMDALLEFRLAALQREVFHHASLH
jgi:hypothetical protein